MTYITQKYVICESESEVGQSCPTLCDPVDCSLPGFSIHGILRARITGVGYHFLLQGIFPTQGRTRVSHIGCRHLIHNSKPIQLDNPIRLAKAYNPLLIRINFPRNIVCSSDTLHKQQIMNYCFK